MDFDFFSFKYEYVSEKPLLNERIGYIHQYLYHQYTNRNQDRSWISSRFVKQILQLSEMNLFSVAEILYKHGFIHCFNQDRRHKYYYRYFKMKQCDLETVPVSEKSRKMIFNNLYLLDYNESIPFQHTMFYRIVIDRPTLVKEVVRSRELKPGKHEISEEEEIDKLWKSICKHNNNVNNGIKPWTKDTFSGRRHHFPSYNKSFLRQYTDKGPLVELDVFQCQPTNLAYIFDRFYPGNDYSSLFYDDDFDIYTKLSDDRDEGKDEFFKLLFGYQDSEKLKRLFPTMYDTIIKIKKEAPELIGIDKNEKGLRLIPKYNNKGQETTRYNYTLKYWKYYKAINLAAQKMEVEIFEKIWIDLLKKNIFFIPVHDAVYCLNKDWVKVKSIMHKHFDKYIKDSRVRYRIVKKMQN